MTMRDDLDGAEILLARAMLTARAQIERIERIGATCRELQALIAGVVAGREPPGAPLPDGPHPVPLDPNHCERCSVLAAGSSVAETPIALPSDSPGMEPAWKSGYIPPQVWKAIEAVAPLSGVLPEVLAAIQVHETGWYLSPIMKDCRNPGGMKWSASLWKKLGVTADYTAAHPAFTRFPTWQDGVGAHSLFLTQSRYDGIRNTKVAALQLDAIGAAGYAEGSPSWLRDTKALAARFTTERRRVSTDSVADRIAALALTHVGEPIDYDPLTAVDGQLGRLGCANAASHMLIEAGVMIPIILGVDKLANALKSLGWFPIGGGAPHKGDVPVIDKPPPKGEDDHKHIGILALQDGKLVFINNHGYIPEIGADDWASYGREIEEVLRHPGGKA